MKGMGKFKNIGRKHMQELKANAQNFYLNALDVFM